MLEMDRVELGEFEEPEDDDGPTDGHRICLQLRYRWPGGFGPAFEVYSALAADGRNLWEAARDVFNIWRCSRVRVRFGQLLFSSRRVEKFLVDRVEAAMFMGEEAEVCWSGVSHWGMGAQLRADQVARQREELARTKAAKREQDAEKRRRIKEASLGPSSLKCIWSIIIGHPPRVGQPLGTGSSMQARIVCGCTIHY
jgi:hypothetical protein